MGARLGRGPETERHSQEESETQRDRIWPLGLFSLLTFGEFSFLQGLCVRYALTFNRDIFEVSLCQGAKRQQ